MPPASRQITRDSSLNDFFAGWVAEEDHFGSPAKPGSKRRPAQQQPQAQALSPQVHESSVDASTQTADAVLETSHATRVSVAAPQPAPSRPAPQPEATARQRYAPTPSAPAHAPAAAPRTRSANQPRRTRDQVTRDSYQLLWREYLALTSAEAEEQQRRHQQRLANSFSLSRIASVLGGTAAASPDAALAQAQAQAHAQAAAQAATMSSTTAQAATILQGPLDYTKPKGLDKVLVTLLCPPSDLLDMQRLTKLGVKVFTLICKLLVALSFLVIPAWLWLVRHEWAIGHTGDAVAVGVAGVLLFLAADATNKAATSSAAAAKTGVFTASERSAYQSSPGYVASVAAAAPPAGAAATHAAAAHRPTGAAVGAAHRSVPAYQAASSDPAVRQVKQRIMKLERLLFGNELTEADIGPDMLQGRVQALCLEVGVPFGGHGRSSSHMSAGELDAQLQAVEKALGI